MNASQMAKCACQHCGLHLEFPLEGAGSVIICPACQKETTLYVPAPPDASPHEATTVADSSVGQYAINDIVAAFSGPVRPRFTSLVYQLGLLVVAIAMILLPLVYLGMIGMVIMAVIWWAKVGLVVFSGGGGAYVTILKLCLYIAPLFTGAVTVFFMGKPLFARRPPQAQPLALNPVAEPVLFTFIGKVCEMVGAPAPTRIDLDCHFNASASLRKGVWSMLGSDLVLTIGLPLVASLNVREFAGVLAHEFGHFTQGFAMRLTYIIRRINGWFFRVVYERDAWDVSLEEWAQTTQDWRMALIIHSARLGVWFSRACLKILMYVGHGIGCFMLRQMEYDADYYQIQLAGSPYFESTMKRLHSMGFILGQTYKGLRAGWNINRHLPDNFPAHFIQQSQQVKPETLNQLEDTAGLQSTGLFDTHPSNGDRIRQARKAGAQGLFQGEGLAAMLFTNFEVISKQITLLHYSDDLGIPLSMIRLMPVEHGA